MKQLKKYQWIVPAGWLLAFPGFAADVELKLNRADGIYAAGAPVICTVTVKEAGAPVKEGRVVLSVLKNGAVPGPDRELPLTNGVSVFDGAAFAGPVSLIFTAKLAGTDHKDSIGALVDSHNFVPGRPEPADFDAFWTEQKKELAALGMQAEWTPVSQDRKGIECFDVQIPCIGECPASGYYARPAGAAKGSLPAVLVLHGAGVSGDWTFSRPTTAAGYAARGGGSISLDLNAHGLPNGRPVEFYKAQEQGPLKNYPMQGIESRDTFYFRFMYLRLLQAVNFLASQPEWDGRILAIGESQGGGQALAIAGLDRRVTAVAAVVPALCDLSGTLAGRDSGWPKPLKSNPSEKAVTTVAYFDNAHLSARSHAKTLVEVGLIDTTCPPCTVYAACNRLKGNRTIIPVPYRPHHAPQGTHRNVWLKGPHAEYERFIDDFLKPSPGDTR